MEPADAGERTDAEYHNIEAALSRQNQLGRGTHCPDIGSEIEDIRNRDYEEHAVEKRPGIIFSQVRRDADAGHSADAGADLLNGSHQRICQYHRPEQGISELRSHLGIGADSAGIVIGGTGYKSWAELLKK